MQYPKIQTLFNRDLDTFKVIPGEFRWKEFEQIKQWEVTEKIHGMNMRVIYKMDRRQTGMIGMAKIMEYTERSLRFAGRTDKAQIPPMLQEYMEKTFTLEKMAEAFPDLEKSSDVILFGEGYGEKINNGGNYTGKGVKFRLFDVFITDQKNPFRGWWLESENVKNIADKLNIETVPIIGIYTTEDIIDWFIHSNKYPWGSIVQFYDNPDADTILMEGIVARTKPLMFTRRGKRIIWKLKISDF